MQKSKLVLLFILTSILILSCSDDDNPVISSSGSILARGYVMLSPELSINIDFFGISPSLTNIDSVVSADSLLYLSRPRPSVDFYGTSQNARYNNWADSLRFSSGDIIKTTIFSPGGNSVCEVPVLDSDHDTIQLVSGSIPTTIPQYGQFTMHWHPMANADWYLVEFHHSGPGGPHGSLFSADTFITVDSAYTGSRVQMTIQPVTGPLPTDLNGNISGGNVVGSIYGTTWGRYFTVDVATTKKTVIEHETKFEKSHPFDALNALLDQYQK